MNDNNQKKSTKKGGFVAGVAVCLVLVAALIAIGNIKLPTPAPAPVPTEEITVATTEAPKELTVSDLMREVTTLKKALEDAAEDLAEGNLELASLKFDNADTKAVTIRDSMAASLEAMGDSMPSLTAQMMNIQELTELVQLANRNLLQPLIVQLGEHPISGVLCEDGINVSIAWDYLDFLESRMPELTELVTRANSADLSIVDSDGDMTEYLDKLSQVLDIYQADPSVLAKMKTVLGADGDRLYVVAAQNSAEVRASGGFPGAVGSIQIRDGILVVNDFTKVYSVFATNTPPSANITQTEARLFHSGLSAPRDADYCPDFERVASIWALGYESKMGENVDGVVSMTPAIVQKLLAAIGEEITLFDGLVLDGSNAAKVLQHDLYFKYFGPEYVTNAAIVTDQLFADAAKKLVQKVMENLEPDDLMAYLSIAKDAFEDRTLMLWAKDEGEQALIRKLGWDASLNDDPRNPWAGVYFNCTIASKMGWYLAVDTQLGSGTRNEDGSYTYPMTVTFTNTITAEEVRSAQAYITSGAGGAYTGSAYFFAPAGGTVSDFQAPGAYVQKDTYHDLELGFISSFSIAPGKSLTVTYNLTTAPGVDTVPVISRTPTMQEYH